jgi:uncharacterized protein YgbK (DUF1537 family)
VKDGRIFLTLAVSFQPIDVQGVLQGSGLDSVVLAEAAEIVEAVCGGARIVVLDAASDVDLLEITRRTLELDRRILWVGSGGLASALARSLPVRAAALCPALHPRKGLLFCVGSDHPSTAAQQSALLAHTSAVLLHGCYTNGAEIAIAIASGHHVCLQLPRDRSSQQQIAQLLDGVSPGAIILTGGDTAALVCRAMGTRHIDLYGEITAGIPVGIARGGPFDGIRLVTKSGAFGDANAFIQVADYCSCPRR